MAQLTIDTLNKTDRDNAMVALHAMAINNGEDPLFCPIKDYNDIVCSYDALHSDYQKYQDENKLLNEELSNEKKRNEQLFDANKTLRNKIETYNSLNNELETEIKELKEKLSAFIVGYGEDGNNELKYFKPEELKLEKTIQTNAFFIGASKGDDVFEYQFNEEKGGHQKAIQLKNNMLIPFCDIVNEVPDANYISNKHKGVFSIANGDFKIIEKAKISLVKQ